MLFRNFYRCVRCGHLWTDVWSATCDDDCSHCGARHMSPYKSEDQDEHRPLERNNPADHNDQSGSRRR